MTVDPTVLVAALGTLASALTFVARFVYLDLRRDRDYWRAVALKALGHTEQALEVAKARADV